MLMGEVAASAVLLSMCHPCDTWCGSVCTRLDCKVCTPMAYHHRICAKVLGACCLLEEELLVGVRCLRGTVCKEIHVTLVGTSCTVSVKLDSASALFDEDLCVYTTGDVKIFEMIFRVCHSVL